MRKKERTRRFSPLGLTGATVSFLIGVVLVQWLARLPPWWIAALLVAVFIWFCGYYPRLRWIGLLVLGAAWATWRADIVMGQRLPRQLEKVDIDVVGHVVGLPQSQPVANRFVFEVTQAWLDDNPIPWHGRIRLSWYGVKKGQPASCSSWHLRVRLKRPRSLMNPGGYDSERAALSRHMTAQGYVRAKGDNHQIAYTAWCVAKWRNAISTAIGRAVENPTDAALLQALAVGDTRHLESEDWRIARVNGVSHLLAISGFHVGIAALFGAWIAYGFWWLFPGLGRRWPRPTGQALVALITALAYGAMAGFGLPTVRSVLMIAVVVIARLSYRNIRGPTILSAALLCILLFDPLAVLSPGFWLSFAGVALLMSGLSQATSRHGYIKLLCLTEVFLTVALVPLTVWFFGQASLLGAVSNLFAIPIVSFLVIPLILTGCTTFTWFPWLAHYLWLFAAWCMHGLWWVLSAFAHIEWINWHPPSASLFAVILAILGALWWFMPRGFPLRWLGWILFLPLVFPPKAAIEPGSFNLWVIDVGQGLSMLVQTRHHSLVFDTGARYPSGYDLGQAAVIPTLQALGVHRLDKLIISHGDNDHAGGARSVVNAFAPKERLSGEPARVHLGMEKCHAGQHWTWDGVAMQILSPAPDSHVEGNDASCVLLITGQAGRALLTGDISAKVEEQLIAAIPEGLPVVLQVAHHGSKTSSSEVFLQAVDPIVAIASSGWLNRFHHPAESVVSRYRKNNIRFLDTARTGAVKIVFPADGKPYIGAQWRVKKTRYWRE